ncbi:unnamed protein product [Calypogeia fissa]
MKLLGVEEWFNVYQLAQKSGIQMAIQRIQEYSNILECMEGDDAFELEKAQILVRAVEIALTQATADTELAKKRGPSAVSVLSSTSGPSIAADIATLVGGLLNVVATTIPSSSPIFQLTIVIGCSDATSSVAWGTISTAEVLQCHDRALNAVTLCDKALVFVCKWPMTIFGAPKYKCRVAAGAKVRGPLDTKISRITEHKSKLWNWIHPYFRCSCYFKAVCNGQLIWLDHVVWYMLNHLEEFFTASTIQGRLVMLIQFLSGDARRMVLDHITFLYIRDFTIEASQELIDHPTASFLTHYGPSRGIRMVEALVKPGTFSEDLGDILGGSSKKRWNLNDHPQAPPKRWGMYANHTSVPDVGRGSTTAPLIRCCPDGANSRVHPGIGRTLSGNESPLQRRNLHF